MPDGSGLAMTEAPHARGPLLVAPQWRGPWRPSTSTPLLAPGVLRRTSTVDVIRPQGPNGVRMLMGHARDAIGASSIREIAHAAVEAKVTPDGTAQFFAVDGSEMA